MHKALFLLVTAAIAAAFMTMAAAAKADVPRYQIKTATLTATLPSYGYVHTFSVTINPCDGAFAGTGAFAGAGLPAGAITEKVTGTLVGNQVSFASTYDPTSLFPGYKWQFGPAALGAAVVATDSSGASFTTTTQLTHVTESAYRNHGDYVSQMGGGADAAHSCIGMPIVPAQ
jgi:hypothetical protein